METSRRNFLRKATQLTFLSAMVCGSAYLLSHDRIQLDGCAENKFCKNCQKLNNCSLEQAKKQKENER